MGTPDTKQTTCIRLVLKNFIGFYLSACFFKIINRNNYIFIMIINNVLMHNVGIVQQKYFQIQIKDMLSQIF